jgi:hypothetical protein
VIATADNPPPDQWLIVALEEYKSLRIEIVDAIEAQRKIMQLGVTALSVLIGLGLQQINPFLAVVLLTLLVPTVAILSRLEHSVSVSVHPERAIFSLAGKSLLMKLSLDPNRPWRGKNGFEVAQYSYCETGQNFLQFFPSQRLL